MNKENTNSCSSKPAEQKIAPGLMLLLCFLSFFFYIAVFSFFNKTKQITKQKTKRKKKKETNQQSKDIVNWVGDGISKYDHIKNSLLKIK